MPHSLPAVHFGVIGIIGTLAWQTLPILPVLPPVPDRGGAGVPAEKTATGLPFRSGPSRSLFPG